MLSEDLKFKQNFEKKYMYIIYSKLRIIHNSSLYILKRRDGGGFKKLLTLKAPVTTIVVCFVICLSF